jgi:phage terminase large subunit
MFESGPLFECNYSCPTKVAVNQGGTSSGKTYTILQVLFTIAINDPGCVITVVGQDIPNLKKGAMRDAHNIVAKSPELQKMITSYNKSDRIYEFSNGAIMEFTSYSDEQDAKSGKRDYLFLNEANGIAYAVYWQLAIRTRKKIFVDYNPTAKFWAHDKLIGQANTTLYISDHRHNPFLSEELHDEIENIDDKELWKVYARGLTGQVKGLIYPKYQLCTGIPEFVNTNYGLDFGYNHKTALIETGKWDNRMYWNEVIYQSELTISDLIHLMKELGIDTHKKIFADHANPDKIEDLKLAGYTVISADKDVKNGIDYVKRHQLYITDWSKGLIAEANTYKWKETRDGHTLDEPVKFKDDGMDGGRYGAYSSRDQGGVVVSSSRSHDDYDILDDIHE